MPTAADTLTNLDTWPLEFSIQTSYKQAKQELRDDGQPETDLELGKIYFSGKGVNKNLSRAKHYFKRAAKEYFSEAKLWLALWPVYVKRSKAKQPKAFEQVAELAKTDYPFAQYALASLYEKGIGTEKDPQQSIKWLTRAAYAPVPVPLAQTRLARYYQQGYEPYLAPDKQKAFELFLAAAQAEEQEAAYYVAQLYAQGEGTEKNEARAFYFMRQAARQHVVEAQIALSQFYQDGIGVQPDSYGVFKWMYEAARQDNAYAQEQTALNYLHGTGVAKNHQEALNWAEKAQKNGGKNAADILRQIKEDL